MRLISPPKWPSVNPFSHPLGSKIGRKPMVTPSKWANLKSNFLKFYHRNQVILGIEKARKMAYFRAFLALLSCRLSLAELRCAASCLQTVLLSLLHTRISREEACLLQHRTIVLICFKQCSRDAVTDSACLAGHTAADDIDADVKLLAGLSRNKRLTNRHSQNLKAKIVLDVSLVDRNLTSSRHQIDSGNRSFSSSGSVISLTCHFLHAPLSL